MRTNLRLKDHGGWLGLDSPRTNLRSDFGLGQDNNGEWFLVSVCDNCGDYSQISVKEILEALEVKNESLSSTLQTEE